MGEAPDFHQMSRSVAKTVDRCIYRGLEDEVTDAYEDVLRSAWDVLRSAHAAAIRETEERIAGWLRGEQLRVEKEAEELAREQKRHSAQSKRSAAGVLAYAEDAVRSRSYLPEPPQSEE